jgi:hypothetical protein
MRRRIGVERKSLVAYDCVGWLCKRTAWRRSHLDVRSTRSQRFARVCRPLDTSRSIAPSPLYRSHHIAKSRQRLGRSCSNAFRSPEYSIAPSANGGVSQDNSAFGHHPDQVSGTQLETEVPADAKHNDFLIEMSSFEEISRWQLCGHLTIIAVHRLLSAFAPEPFPGGVPASKSSE